MIFLDTCILIDYSKGNITIKENDKKNYCFSSIVQLEFTTGALDKRELKKINKILSEFKLIDTDQDVLINGEGKIMRSFSPMLIYIDYQKKNKE